MHLDRVWLTDFRSYRAAEVAPAPAGLTLVVGPNGAGKTNLLEAIGYLATLRSFRDAPTEALVRSGASSAVVRAEGEREGRRLLIETELRLTGRDRVQVNRQPLRRARDLIGAIQVTVFSPDDLRLVKGSPGERREYLDDLLVALHPRHDAARREVERVLRQRSALLRSVQGQLRPDADVVRTLDVWDDKLAAGGEALVRAREGLVVALRERAARVYQQLAVGPPDGNLVRLEYQRSWAGGLLDALKAARGDDLRRGVTTVGPHRDELVLSIGELPARSHGSQGEQRSLALSLRLAGHHVVAERVGSFPVLLLDDVFSELDADRAAALLAVLPAGQALLTTATGPPPGARPEVVVRVKGDTLRS